MIFLCYPKCSTCQKAQKWLDANGASYELRNIKDDNPTEAELRAWHKLPGMTEDEMYAHRRRLRSGRFQGAGMGKNSEVMIK